MGAQSPRAVQKTEQCSVVRLLLLRILARLALTRHVAVPPLPRVWLPDRPVILDGLFVGGGGGLFDLLFGRGGGGGGLLLGRVLCVPLLRVLRGQLHLLLALGVPLGRVLWVILIRDFSLVLLLLRGG